MVMAPQLHQTGYTPSLSPTPVLLKGHSLLTMARKTGWMAGLACMLATTTVGQLEKSKDSGSVIEGKYSDYEVADLFATDYTFHKFEANC